MEVIKCGNKFMFPRLTKYMSQILKLKTIEHKFFKKSKATNQTLKKQGH